MGDGVGLPGPASRVQAVRLPASISLEKGELIQYLNDVAPFPTAPTERPAATMEWVNIEDVAFKYHPLFPRFG